MDDAVLMSRFERLRDLSRNGERIVERNRSALNPLVEGQPLDEFEHESGGPARLFDAVDRADVRLVERGERLRLALEACAPLRIVRERLGKDLDRDRAIELRVTRAINLAHAARANRRDDFLGAEAGSDSDSQCVLAAVTAADYSVPSTPMIPLRPLGSTGLRVTPIGLGLAALGRPAYITSGRDQDLGGDRSVESMERRCHDVLDAAYSAGVGYFDAARSYGFAEAFLESWLAKRPPAPALPALPALPAPVIGSKWGYTYVGGWQMDAAVHEQKNLSVETLTRQIGESRALLGDSLRLYQMHSATIESGVFDDVRLIAALSRLREEGLVIGLTTTGPRQADTIRRALDVRVEGRDLFQVVQSTWNVLEPSSGPALAEAHAAGWGVIVKEALANGRLANQDQLAIAMVVRQPWADVVLSGAVTAEHLYSNVRALDVTLTPQGIDLLQGSVESPETYWAKRAARRWR
jgi:aryl-alcohol dehydrogenase-like predicted oxidoreductase